MCNNIFRYDPYFVGPAKRFINMRSIFKDIVNACIYVENNDSIFNYEQLVKASMFVSSDDIDIVPFLNITTMDQARDIYHFSLELWIGHLLDLIFMLREKEQIELLLRATVKDVSGNSLIIGFE